MHIHEFLFAVDISGYSEHSSDASILNLAGEGEPPGYPCGFGVDPSSIQVTGLIIPS